MQLKSKKLPCAGFILRTLGTWRSAAKTGGLKYYHFAEFTKQQYTYTIPQSTLLRFVDSSLCTREPFLCLYFTDSPLRENPLTVPYWKALSCLYFHRQFLLSKEAFDKVLKTRLPYITEGGFLCYISSLSRAVAVPEEKSS